MVAHAPFPFRDIFPLAVIPVTTLGMTLVVVYKQWNHTHLFGARLRYATMLTLQASACASTVAAFVLQYASKDTTSSDSDSDILRFVLVLLLVGVLLGVLPVAVWLNAYVSVFPQWPKRFEPESMPWARLSYYIVASCMWLLWSIIALMLLVVLIFT